MRASDDDRQRVVVALEKHTGAGRLTLDEFGERVGVVAQARTLDELAAVVSDLPGESVVPVAGPESHRELLWVFIVAIGAVLLLAIALALR